MGVTLRQLRQVLRSGMHDPVETRLETCILETWVSLLTSLLTTSLVTILKMRLSMVTPLVTRLWQPSRKCDFRTNLAANRHFAYQFENAVSVRTTLRTGLCAPAQKVQVSCLPAQKPLILWIPNWIPAPWIPVAHGHARKATAPRYRASSGDCTSAMFLPVVGVVTLNRIEGVAFGDPLAVLIAPRGAGAGWPLTNL